MKVEPTMLVVSGAEAPADLLTALEEQGVFVERAGPASFAEVLPVVAPDLVLAVGAAYALPMLEVLRATDKTTRARLAVVADPDAQSALRQLDRELLVTILSSDVPTSALAVRLATVAKRLAERAAAERASSRPPAVVTTTAAARPLPNPPAPAVRSPGSPGERAGVDRPKGLRSLTSAGLPRRGTLSSDKLKAVPLPDLSLPQRPDGSKWRRSGRAHRVVLADDDVTRGAAIAQALIARGLEVQVVPLDPARTRWAQLQAHNPEVLIVDEVGSTDHGQVWLELFAADRVLSTARVIKVSLRALFDERTLSVSLKALEKHIEGLAAWRHEMPTIIDDEERPTLVGGNDDSGPHPVPASTDFDGDFDDRPTMARGPATEARAPLAEPPAPPTPSYGPPSVQLNDSIIAESKSFFGTGAPPPAPLPTQSSHPPRPIASAPAPTSWQPMAPPAPASWQPSAQPPSTPPPSAPPPSTPPPASSPPLLGSRPPGGPLLSAPLAAGTPLGPMRTSRFPTSPSTRLAAELAPPRRSQRSGWLWVALLAVVVGGGFGLYRAGLIGAPPSASEPRAAASVDTPAAREGDRPQTAPSSSAAAAAGSVSPISALWTTGTGQAPACEKVVDPPPEVTALTLAAGSRAWEKARGLLVLGDMAGAQKQMCTAVFNHPQSLALEGLAALYLTLRTPSEALRWVEQALGVRPDRPKTLELYGDVLITLGREADAKKAWLSGLGMAPGQGDQAILLLSKNLTDEADKALRSGDLPRAEQLARRAAGLDMKSPRAAGTMAAILLAAKERALAVRWTARCIELGREEPSCLLAQGDLALDGGDLKTARAHYEKVTRLAPGDRRAWQKLGGSTASVADEPASEAEAETATPPVEAEPAPAEPLLE